MPYGGSYKVPLSSIGSQIRGSIFEILPVVWVASTTKAAAAATTTIYTYTYYYDDDRDDSCCSCEHQCFRNLKRRFMKLSTTFVELFTALRTFVWAWCFQRNRASPGIPRSLTWYRVGRKRNLVEHFSCRYRKGLGLRVYRA